MSDKMELMPCPFCGKNDAFVEQLDSDASVVICQGRIDEYSACLARGPVGVQESDFEDQPGKDAAIREWNHRAALAQQPAAAVPEGWKLAPVDATLEMVEAFKARATATSRGTILNVSNALNDAIAAAPAAPVAQEPAAWVCTARKPGITEQRSLWHGEQGADTWLAHFAGRGCEVTKTPLYTAPPVAEQPARAMQALATISRMARNEACRSGAPAAGQLCTWDSIADMADAALADAPTAEQPDTVNLLTAALKPFADAFEATGLPQYRYREADAEHAAFLDENQVTPAQGITMGQFRRAWEVLSGKSVLRGAEQPDASAQLASIEAMCAMVEAREWADHVGVGEIGKRVESAISTLRNELQEAQRTAMAEHPDAVRVLHELPVDDIERRVASGHLRCTCPSGDGSLRWPCPAHPPSVSRT